MFREFKEFTIRGNVLDLAVAVIIGAAFGTIITFLVNDVLMPLGFRYEVKSFAADAVRKKVAPTVSFTRPTLGRAVPFRQRDAARAPITFTSCSLRGTRSST
jgi:hypothetical protein